MFHFFPLVDLQTNTAFIHSRLLYVGNMLEQHKILWNAVWIPDCGASVGVDVVTGRLDRVP